MSPDNVYAAVEIGVVIITIANLAAGVERPIPRRRRLLLAWGLIVSGMVFMGFAGTGCLCMEDHTLAPAFIGWVCTCAMLAYARHRIPAYVTMTIVFLMSVGLNRQYSSLVHSTAYTSGTQAATRRNNLYTPILKYIPNLADKYGLVGQQVDAGWVADWPCVANETDETNELLRESVHHEAIPFWHSLFTRLFREDSTRVALWWPGGVMDQSLDALEFRVRPD